jgi:SAM-dependent methyltransferase
MCSMHTFADLYTYLQSNTDHKSIKPFLEDNWVGKEKQESLFRLFAHLQLIPDFNKYKLCQGNFNNVTIEPLSSLDHFMKGTLKDNGDKSDLTLIDEESKEIVACSSKNMKDYGVGDLDVRDILYLYEQKYKQVGYKLRLCLVVRDKEILYTLIQNALKCNDDITSELLSSSTLVFDWNDIQVWYTHFVHNYKRVSLDQLDEMLMKKNKSPLTLRMHQSYAVDKTLGLLIDHDNILWGHIPRSGKSYIMAGLINAFMEYQATGNYLIITTSPKETVKQYMDVFSSHIQFNKANIIVLNGTTKKPTNMAAHNIIIASKQFLQTKGVKDTQEKTKQIPWLKGMIIDLRFIDESHNGGTTELMQKTLETYGESCKTIYITATYLKPVNSYKLPKDAWVLWDIEDVKICKTISDAKSKIRLAEKYGNGILSYIEKYGETHIMENYNVYPELHIMTTSFRPDVKKELKDFISENQELGWSLESLFLLKNNGSATETEFQNEEQMLKMCHSIFGKTNTSTNGKFTSRSYDSIFSRISSICQNPEFKSRTFSVENPLSVLAFLPCGTGIELVSESFRQFLVKHNILPDFNILVLNSGTNGNKDVSTLIHEAMAKVKNEQKKGLLMLSGRQCSMGITLKHCDIVLLMNSSSSADLLYQMMFRCLSEDTGKRCGFVVDLNIQRVADVMIDWALKTNPDKGAKEALKVILEQRLVHLNSDEWMHTHFGLKGIDVDGLVSSIYSIWTAKPSNAIKRVLDVLQFKFELFNKADQKQFNELFCFVRASRSHDKNKVKEIIAQLSGNDTDISEGVKKTPIESRGSDTGTDGKDDNGKESETFETNNTKQDVNFIRDILRHLIPLICILTIHDRSCNTFAEMCLSIDGNTTLKDIFIKQIQIWWGKHIPSEIFTFFVNMYNKYLRENTEINQVVVRVKELFTQSIHNQKELANIIDEYLVPQELEKKQNAEVSTPPQLRKDMLDALEKYVPNFFKSLRKVFEPCCGKGQFIIDIIDRFMHGLKDLYPNEKERYRVIVEECIFFADINPTNIFICRLLLDPYGEYKLNFYQGDTLKIDVEKEWGIKGFDGVIGNPPYNSSGDTGTGNTIWQHFVLEALKVWLAPNGHLVFVHPPGWRKPNTEKGRFQGLFHLMTALNHMRYLEIHGVKDGMKCFSCGTRYDWYVISKTLEKNIRTCVQDEKGNIHDINMLEWKWFPSSNVYQVKRLLATEKDEMCNIIQSMSAYEPRKTWISKTRDEVYKYPVVHSTTQKGTRFVYSSLNTNGHFGISKVIFGDSCSKYPIKDMKGEYGMTQHAMAIGVRTEEEADLLITAIKSSKFQEIMESCCWSSFAIDWSMFNSFRNDFWKEFI